MGWTDHVMVYATVCCVWVEQKLAECVPMKSILCTNTRMCSHQEHPLYNLCVLFNDVDTRQHARKIKGPVRTFQLFCKVCAANLTNWSEEAAFVSLKIKNTAQLTHWTLPQTKWNVTKSKNLVEGTLCKWMCVFFVLVRQSNDYRRTSHCNPNRLSPQLTEMMKPLKKLHCDSHCWSGSSSAQCFACTRGGLWVWL